MVLHSTSVDNRLSVLFRRQETIPICLLGYLTPRWASRFNPPCSTVDPLLHATSTGEKWKGPNLPTFLSITFHDRSKLNPLSIIFSIPTQPLQYQKRKIMNEGELLYKKMLFEALCLNLRELGQVFKDRIWEDIHSVQKQAAKVSLPQTVSEGQNSWTEKAESVFSTEKLLKLRWILLQSLCKY